MDTAPGFRSQARAFGLSVLRAVIVTSIVVAGIIFIFKGQSAQDAQAREQTVSLLRAVGCELGVPAIDGVRSPVLLRACWTDEGLAPPAFFDET